MRSALSKLLPLRAYQKSKDKEIDFCHLIIYSFEAKSSYCCKLAYALDITDSHIIFKHEDLLAKYKVLKQMRGKGYLNTRSTGMNNIENLLSLFFLLRMIHDGFLSVLKNKERFSGDCQLKETSLCIQLMCYL